MRSDWRVESFGHCYPFRSQAYPCASSAGRSSELRLGFGRISLQQCGQGARACSALTASISARMNSSGVSATTHLTEDEMLTAEY